eukprot:TRINITY_DN1893_c0_g1_i2.p1 TRINITY_DN1893_c0_g1~~TRINITY_DN1893_c0_g1_i2.p1  ORF type:complete len:102 (+),score=8.26 TRINITY_DN1893_c0_g1_i2:183-488(+)
MFSEMSGATIFAQPFCTAILHSYFCTRKCLLEISGAAIFVGEFSSFIRWVVFHFHNNCRRQCFSGTVIFVEQRTCNQKTHCPSAIVLNCKIFRFHNFPFVL